MHRICNLISLARPFCWTCLIAQQLWITSTWISYWIVFMSREVGLLWYHSFAPACRNCIKKYLCLWILAIMPWCTIRLFCPECYFFLSLWSCWGWGKESSVWFSTHLYFFIISKSASDWNDAENVSQLIEAMLTRWRMCR